MVICLERCADLHMAQKMPLPLTVSCFSKIQIGLTLLVPADPGSPGKRAVKRVCVCVYVCIVLAVVCVWRSATVGCCRSTLRRTLCLYLHLCWSSYRCGAKVYIVLAAVVCVWRSATVGRCRSTLRRTLCLYLHLCWSSYRCGAKVYIVLAAVVCVWRSATVGCCRSTLRRTLCRSQLSCSLCWCLVWLSVFAQSIVEMS